SASQATCLYEGAPIHGWLLQVKSRRSAYDTHGALYNFCFTIVTIPLRLDTLALLPRQKGHFHYAEMDRDEPDSAPGNGSHIWYARLLTGASASLRLAAE